MRKVLIVDDDRNFRDLLVMKFQKNNYITFFCSTGKEAFEIFEREKPGIVIIDGMLPDYEGFDLSLKIRNSESGKNIIIILISAVYDRLKFLEDARKAGADNILNKPFDLNEFMNYIEKLLEGKRNEGITPQ